MPRTALYDEIPNLSARLRAAREILTLSQADAGRRVGVAWITILRWENGQSRPKSAVLRARVLDLLAAAEQTGNSAYPDLSGDGAGCVRESTEGTWNHGDNSGRRKEEIQRVADRIAARVATLVRAAVIEELSPRVRRKSHPPRS